MPKEYIQATPNTKVVPVVGWQKGVGVQVGTVNLEEPEDSPGRGLFADMGRDEINRLIHLLRRARDAAFGRDA